MHIQDPVHQDSPHILVYLWLAFHVLRIGLRLVLHLLHILLDVLNEIIHLVDFLLC